MIGFLFVLLVFIAWAIENYRKSSAEDYSKHNPVNIHGEKSYYDKDDIPQIVSDYISGMTDQYAIRRYLDLFVPAPLAEHANDDTLLKKAVEAVGKS